METSAAGTYPSEEKRWGLSLEGGLNYARLQAGPDRAQSYGFEASAGMWLRFTPAFKSRVSMLFDYQSLQGEPFQREARDPNPELLSLGIRTGFIFSPRDWLDLGVNLAGGTSTFSGMAGSGSYAEGGLLACLLNSRLCLEGGLRAYGFIYETSPESSPTYPFPHTALSQGFAWMLRASSYWDL